MELNKEAITEFKNLYFQEYGIKLTDNQAVEYGMRLIRFIKAVYGDDLPLRKFDKNNRKSNN